MKVILLKDVKNHGKSGSVIDVADGFANYLIRSDSAAEASKSKIALFEQQRLAKSRREAEARADAEELAKRLAQMQLSVSAKSGGNGRLFGTVTNAQVADAIKLELEIDVDRHSIEVPHNIKSLGTYDIKIHLAKNIVAKTSLKVVAAV